MNPITLESFSEELTKIAVSASDVSSFLTRTPYGGALAGAALGAGAGAGIGALTGRKGERKKRALKGAGIGAGIGALGGAAVGAARGRPKIKAEDIYTPKGIALPPKAVYIPKKIEVAKRVARAAKKPRVAPTRELRRLARDTLRGRGRGRAVDPRLARAAAMAERQAPRMIRDRLR